MKKILVTDGNGNYGHAVEKRNNKGTEYIEVRMFDDYDNVHTTNWTTFLIYYEVCDDAND